MVWRNLGGMKEWKLEFGGYEFNVFKREVGGMGRSYWVKE